GKTQAVEKSTRVKARVKAHALKEFIDSKEKVVVMGHKLIDVDAFGAAVGIYRASRTMGKKAYIVIDTPTSSTQPFIDMFRRDTEYDPRMFLNTHDAKDMVDDDTLLVVVDTSKPSYTGCEELLYQTRSIVVLDHHRQANEFIHDPVLSYIEPYASSACEMVAEILQYFTEGMKIRSIEADVMYAGIQVDTDNFIQKTGVRTFEAAAFLRRCGADVTRVRKMFREDVNDYRAKGETLKNAEMYRGQFIISVCPSDYIKSPTIVGAQAANQLLNIVGVRASFVLTEYKNVIYISARAIDEVNVQIIMERMGGGGHLNIAGCQLKCSIDEARDRLKSVIDEMLDGGEI
ncbi:MAG: DHH family phosphoesterase, partial [Eubacterium sp.]|nr:DHH family phosphoesterase [Eubacterium sp.]